MSTTAPSYISSHSNHAVFEHLGLRRAICSETGENAIAADDEIAQAVISADKTVPFAPNTGFYSSTQNLGGVIIFLSIVLLYGALGIKK